jgi:hypothetical protein
MTPKEAKMIERFRAFSDQDQELLLRIIESLSKPIIESLSKPQRAETIAPPNNIVKFPLKASRIMGVRQ